MRILGNFALVFDLLAFQVDLTSVASMRCRIDHTDLSHEV